MDSGRRGRSATTARAERPVTLGNDLWAGGKNMTSFQLFSFLPGSTLKVDGTALVENGSLKF